MDKNLPIMDFTVEFEFLLYVLSIGTTYSILIDGRIYYASLLYSFDTRHYFYCLYDI